MSRDREYPLRREKSDGRSLPPSRYNSRPPTRSGSRPSTADSLRHSIGEHSVCVFRILICRISIQAAMSMSLNAVAVHQMFAVRFLVLNMHTENQLHICGAV